MQYDDEPKRSFPAGLLNGVLNLVIIALVILGLMVVANTLEYYSEDRILPRCTEWRLVRAININFR